MVIASAVALSLLGLLAAASSHPRKQPAICSWHQPKASCQQKPPAVGCKHSAAAVTVEKQSTNKHQQK